MESYSPKLLQVYVTSGSYKLKEKNVGRFKKFNIKGDFTMENNKHEKVLQEVRLWLQDELKLQTEANSVLDKINNETTSSEYTCYGRWECAQALLSYMDTCEAKILHGVGENFEGEKFNNGKD